MDFAFVVYGDPCAWRGVSFAIRRMRLAQQRYVEAAVFERPKCWPLDARYDVRVSAYEAKARRGVDVCDLAKFALDALQGVAFANDTQVSTLTVERLIDDREPRTEVRVALVEGAGE